MLCRSLSRVTPLVPLVPHSVTPAASPSIGTRSVSLVSTLGLTLRTGIVCPRVTHRCFSSSSSPSSGAKLWGGRFSGATDPRMEAFNASIGYDRRLCFVDLEGSRQYAAALARCGIITDVERDELQRGLDLVEEEWRTETFQIQSGDEDIHTANERRLSELIGSVAGKLHTGRSRNDQVATDMRLWLREQVDDLLEMSVELIAVTTDRARNDIDVLMPGYTHLQPAQPIRWSHFLMRHAVAWRRDAERLQQLRSRVDVMPLGSGALAGHPFNIDRATLAESLSFSGGPSRNSLDAVSDRDFIVEVGFWASLASVHLSQFAEDLLIYSSNEFGFLKLSDAYSTGSSLMPQKKNGDALELLRGKSGRVIGDTTGLLVAMKGLPTAYNKDLQEDKEPMFDVVDTMKGTLPITAGVVATLDVQADNMKKALSADMLATDLADYLVRKGVPFRETHHIAGEAVKLAEEANVPLSALTVKDLKPLHDSFEDDVVAVWDFEKSVEARSAAGGTSRSAVLAQIEEMEAWVSQQSK